MKNIIIVGYPKSGNTWITRLTAELVGCPVSGFWQERHSEIAKEGGDRVSDYRCYKAHHQLNEINLEINSNSGSIHLLYVLRDPRDIAVSGANYFNFDKINLIEQLFRKINKRKLYLSLFPIAETYQINRMSRAIIQGDKTLHKWLKISWRNHYKPYLDAGVLFVQYEKMLSSPYGECEKILNYLGIQRDSAFIDKVINNQSFAKKKERFEKMGDKSQKSFLNVGKSGQWKAKLSQKQKDIFLEHLREELLFFGYETDI
ncbi:MAG: sulfotransferase domain-containing protein [Proteobacteria bacterium]|nr:sulfotransferase domain-containing protein [Pseudomonadota bacterium]